MVSPNAALDDVVTACVNCEKASLAGAYQLKDSHKGMPTTLTPNVGYPQIVRLKPQDFPDYYRWGKMGQGYPQSGGRFRTYRLIICALVGKRSKPDTPVPQLEDLARPWGDRLDTLYTAHAQLVGFFTDPLVCALGIECKEGNFVTVPLNDGLHFGFGVLTEITCLPTITVGQ